MHHLLGLSASSPLLLDEIKSVSKSDSDSKPEVKIYSDSVYYNYGSLGISLQFQPTEGYKPNPRGAIELNRLVLDGIDIHNAIGDEPADAGRTFDKKYKPFRRLPLLLSTPTFTPAPDEAAASTSSDEPSTSSAPASSTPFSLTPQTTGKDLVSALGEPARKGGGHGPTGGNIPIWCDWPNFGVMVEFGGADARGPKAWESGRDARWAIASLYPTTNGPKAGEGEGEGGSKGP